MTTHWRIPPTQKIESCGFDFLLADASVAFHNYGVLWLPDRLIYFIDRKPASDIKIPVGFDDPMYMIINLAMGSKWFGGVGVDRWRDAARWSSFRSTACPPTRSIRAGRISRRRALRRSR